MRKFIVGDILATKPLKVSEVNSYIKKVFAGDWLLSNIKVEGEISNFRHHYSGHMYFTLKDEKGKIKCVMFKSHNCSLNIDLKDGMKVVITGYISIYEREGEYQLYAEKIEESGIGQLFKAFEKLKLKLDEEGLFDASKKKGLPFMPKKLGVVTSATGAAVRDIITVIKRRFPRTDILIYPVLVQGVGAPKEICQGLLYLDSREDVDVIITGRGGGSMEELFAFNDEELARTIYKMKTPVISAVGHETDFTIADFVADLRAATPSAAAELATPELNELESNLENNYRQLNRVYSYIMDNSLRELDYINRDLNYYSPINQIRDKYQELDLVFKSLINLMEGRIREERSAIDNIYNKINYLNPISSLERGYNIALDQDGNPLADIEKLSIHDNIRLLFKNGMVEAQVVKISKGEFTYEKQ